jgi:N-acetylglutamate synthase-like GNAT family acetyltransferase
MVIKIAEISKDIDTLPEEAQILLLDFIQLLKKCYPQPENHHQQKSIYEKFDEIGLIGCCAVEENLSTTYKEVLSNTLPNKYDHS